MNSLRPHRLRIENGIFLDDKEMNCVTEYSVTQHEGDDLATLTIKMDVTILNHGQSVPEIKLTPSKITDEYAECDVRLVAGQKK